MIVQPNSRGNRNRRKHQHQGDRRVSVARARAFGLVIFLLFAVLVTRLWFLQIASGQYFRTLAVENRARRIRSESPRGSITDRNGIVLATNRMRFAVYATPDLIKNKVVLGRLALLLHDTPDDIKLFVASAQQNPYDPLRIALDVPIATVTKIEEDRPFLPGVSTEPEPVRWYPNGTLAAQVLGTMGRINEQEFKTLSKDGYFSDDFLGKTGLESQYERYLHGTPGGTDLEVDARGRALKVMDTADSVPGDTLTLAIDAHVQAAAERTLKEHHFVGAAVAINPQTGAVIAMASSPTYDPNAFATGIRQQNWDPLNKNPQLPLINRAVNAMYPPGSTFKPIVAAAGLQTGSITTSSTAYCNGSYYLGRARFGCWQRHGEVNFFSAMAHSCDVFFYIAGQKIGPNQMSVYAKAFGLQEKTGIDLPEEDIGTVPSPVWKEKHFRRLGPDFTKWYGGDTLHMAIGQGDVLTTPLQLARVCATVANGGDVLRPFIVDHITDPTTGVVRFRNHRVLIRHVPVSAVNMESVRQAMRQTVTSGTGRIVNFSQVEVAAKTGSAQVHGVDKTHGLFICFAPYNHPTIAIAGIVERGGHGADTAGKVARAMLEAYFHLPETHEQAARSD